MTLGELVKAYQAEQQLHKKQQLANVVLESLQPRVKAAARKVYKEDRDDFVQDALLAIYKTLPNVKSPEPKQYFDYIIKFAMIKFINKSQKRIKTVSDQDSADEGATGLMDPSLKLDRLFKVITSGKLSFRETITIQHRFGVYGSEPLTCQEIGEFLGISAQAVHQIEKRALVKLKELLPQ